MTRSEALSEARKRWGRGGCVEERKQESSPELREEAKKRREQFKLKFKEPRTREQRNELKSIAAKTWYYRYQVGSIDSLPGLGGVFYVRGQGDTWEEAFANAK